MSLALRVVLLSLVGLVSASALPIVFIQSTLYPNLYCGGLPNPLNYYQNGICIPQPGSGSSIQVTINQTLAIAQYCSYSTAYCTGSPVCGTYTSNVCKLKWNFQWPSNPQNLWVKITVQPACPINTPTSVAFVPTNVCTPYGSYNVFYTVVNITQIQQCLYLNYDVNCNQVSQGCQTFTSNTCGVNGTMYSLVAPDSWSPSTASAIGSMASSTGSTGATIPGSTAGTGISSTGATNNKSNSTIIYFSGAGLSATMSLFGCIFPLLLAVWMLFN